MTEDLLHLKSFLARHEHLFVLTGAGCSTESGIPDYRDEGGAWKSARPIDYQAFMGNPLTRARYWARSMIGWRRFGPAKPNAAHNALARLEQRGCIMLLVTQNVDRLHQAAGSRQVIDMHGRLDEVRCTDCGLILSRASIQRDLELRNPQWLALDAVDAPDGDAHLEGTNFGDFIVPECPHCNGILKPDVVFFGEHVPHDRVEAAYAGLRRATAMLVVGSSLMVYSGYRYIRAAAESGLPIAAINMGRTRADALLTLKIEHPCGPVLAALVR